ncbi:MAG: efflux RND transporter periplasmic adaptor subunit [Pseudomonadota bacterium]
MFPNCRVLLILSSLFFLFLPGCGEKIEPGTSSPPPRPPLKTAVQTLELIQQPLLYEAVGTVQSQTVSTLSGKIMGTVLQVRVKEGDRVKKGDLMITLDSRQGNAQLMQAEAFLSESQNALTAALAARQAAVAGAIQAEAAYKRNLRLLKGEAATREQFEAAEGRHKEAQAALAQADAMVEAARFRIEQAKAGVASASVIQKDAHILAPYDGKITSKMVEVGDLAAPGTPFLTIERNVGYRVDLILPESYIRNIKDDQWVSVSIPAGPQEALRGRIDRVVPGADAKSRTFLVKVELPEHPELRSGMFARVTVPVGENRILAIPESAVVSQGQLTGVYMVDEKNIARFRLIRTGRSFDDLVEVLTGLQEGSRFIVKPPPQLIDGAKVEAIA